MAHYGFTKQYTMLDGSSANSAVRTSNPVFVGDAAYVSVSFFTGAGAASVVSIDASYSDGFTSALTTGAAANVDWLRYASVQTTAALTLGPRWVRATRSAVDSMGSIVLTLRNT